MNKMKSIDLLQELILKEIVSSDWLQCIYYSRNSFGKKAIVLKTIDNILYLKSYNTIVAKIENNELTLSGYYSATTARHINEFLQQNGFGKMSKKELEKYENQE